MAKYVFEVCRLSLRQQCNKFSNAEAQPKAQVSVSTQGESLKTTVFNHFGTKIINSGTINSLLFKTVNVIFKTLNFKCNPH